MIVPILRRVQEEHPDLEIHQLELGVPEQYRLLAAGLLDVGTGDATMAPSGVASEVFRRDPLVCWSGRGTGSPDGKRSASPSWRPSRCCSTSRTARPRRTAPSWSCARAGNHAEPLRAVLAAARFLSRRHGWLGSAGLRVRQPIAR